jgi:hypothetical protein
MSILDRIFRRREVSEPERLPSPDDLALLTRAENEAEASMFRDTLAASGITAMIKNRDVLTAQTGVMAMPWSQELWVLRKDLRRARELLEISDEQA